MTDATPSGTRRTPSEQELADHVPLQRHGREARLGIFVIGGLLSFIVVLFMLTSPAGMRGRYMLHTVVDDAGGVRRNDPIQMRGVNVGRLNKFRMRADGLVEMTLEIEGEWEVPVGSTARLGAVGMFGGRTVEIMPALGDTYHEAGDTISGIGGNAAGILGSMDDLSGQMGTVLTQVETLLSTEAIGSVQGSARELEGLLNQMSGVIAEQRGAMSDLTASLKRSAEGLEGAAAAGPDIASAISRADSIMATLTDTGVALDATLASLQSILGSVERGEGTLGRLIYDEALYDNLNLSSERFAALLQDLQDNPKKYINISIF